MKRRSFVAACILPSIVVSLTALCAERKTPAFDVHQPTIIAFFPPVTDEEVSKNQETNEALDDFQHYAAKVRKPLKRAGISFDEVYADSFCIRNGRVETTFRPEKIKVGYYLVAPGKKPRVEYGVMTDADLLQIANEYFGTKLK